MDLFARIKWLILARRYEFTRKAQEEMEDSGLTDVDVLHAIVHAPSLHEVLRSRSPRRASRGERLYVILGMTPQGDVVYTKGTIRRVGGLEHFYVLISAKRAVYWPS